MTPNTTQTAAMFDGRDGIYEKRVAAWDDEGRALVPDKKGRLVLANECENFLGLKSERPSRPGEKIVTYLPGDGWHVMYATQSDRAGVTGRSETLLPVVAFRCTDGRPFGVIPLVDASGEVVPAGQMMIGDRELMILVDPDSARRWLHQATGDAA